MADWAAAIALALNCAVESGQGSIDPSLTIVYIYGWNLPLLEMIQLIMWSDAIYKKFKKYII